MFCCPAFPALLSKLLLDQTTSCQLTLISHHLLPRPNVEHLCLVVFPLPVYSVFGDSLFMEQQLVLVPKDTPGNF